MTVDTSEWSGEGALTSRLVEALADVAAITYLRVEDAPASRAESGFIFISNELYVRFAGAGWCRDRPQRRWGWLARRREAGQKMNLADLARILAGVEDIGEPDYMDEGLLQYLRTERVVPPYQARGIKLVELVRIYETRHGDREHGSGQKRR